MDWSKAKTILIIVFTIVNMFLLYHLFNINQNGYVKLEPSVVEETIKYLKEKGVAVNTEIPLNTKSISSIIVFEKDYDITTLRALFSQEDKIEISEKKNNLFFRQGDSWASYDDNYLLAYENKSIKPDNEKEFDYKQIANSFLNKLELKNEEKQISKIITKDGYKKISYTQSYRGNIINEAYIELTLSSQGIRNAEIYWFDYMKPVYSKQGIIPPVFALLKTAKYYEGKHDNIKINNIQLAYHYSKHKKTSDDESQTEKNIAIPVWRVDIDKRTVLINAYNEIVEKEIDSSGNEIYSKP